METSLSKKIRTEMITRDITGAGIARKVGVHRSSISKTIKGRIKSFRLRKAVADAIGARVGKLWPKTKGKT